MTPTDPSSERRDLVKRILADSYPRVQKEHREPLPRSVLAELQGEPPAAAPESRGDSLWQRLVSLLRGPQIVGLGVATALVVVAVIAFLPNTESGGGDGGGTSFRSPAGPTAAPPLVVLHGLPDSRLAVLRSSRLFRPEQLTEVPEGGDVAAFLEKMRRPGLILVDWADRTITLPFGTADPPVVIDIDPDTDLETVLLDLLSELAQESPE